MPTERHEFARLLLDRVCPALHPEGTHEDTDAAVSLFMSRQRWTLFFVLIVKGDCVVLAADLKLDVS